MSAMIGSLVTTVFLSLVSPAAGHFRAAASPSPPSTQGECVAELERRGGTVFLRDGHVVEVNLNRTKISDESLALVSSLKAMTDLSLEETGIGDEGLVHVGGLGEIRWLNLYRTRVGDAGLAHLKGLTKLEHLPLGETRVTDAGLVHLANFHRLDYLGCAATRSPTGDLPASGVSPP